MTEAVDVVAGRYRLDGIVGRGGMSDVYRALDLHGDRHVAVKIVRAGDPEFARRLAREARTLERMDHPGLLRLLDTGTVGDRAFIVMELAEGHDLARRLRDGPLTPAATADAGATLAGALAYIHAQGIVHRDVKPANVLFGADGGARLADFGIARVTDGSANTVAGTTLGTTAYMAPEQLGDHRVGPPADIWSLGIVLLECLDGERRYQGTASEVLARRLSGPVPVPGDLPVPWALLLSGMLDPDPDRRPTGDEVLSMLAGVTFRAPWLRATPDAGDLPTVAIPTPGGPAHAPTSGRVDGDPGDTRLAPPGLTAPGPGPGPERTGARRWPWLVAGLVAIGLLAGSLAAFAGGAKPVRQAGATNATTTTTTVAPTTTTVAPGPAALTAFTTAIADGEAAGSVDRAAGSTLSGLAGQAFADQAAGDAAGATQALDRAAAALAADVRNGSVGATQSAPLQADLGQLATALGLPVPAATAPAPTTTAPTAPPAPTGPAGPGHGHGHGKQS